MLISVIIPTCNRNDLLGKCLELLDPKKQIIADRYEVIVTDDNKDFLAKKLIEDNYSFAKWVEGPRNGPATNRNNGARLAKGEWLIFIDDDCLPDEAILDHYKKAIEAHPDCLAFEGTIIPDDWELVKKDLSECPVNIEGGNFWSANVCIQSGLFATIGGFNENYLIAAQEDQQIKLDIERRGQKIVFLKDCKVVHPVRFTTFKKQLTRIPIASRNFILYAYQNKDLLEYKSLSQFAFKQYMFHLRSAVNFIKLGKVKSMLIAFAWLVYGVPLNIINMLKIKR